MTHHEQIRFIAQANMDNWTTIEKLVVCLANYNTWRKAKALDRAYMVLKSEKKHWLAGQVRLQADKLWVEIYGPNLK